jgi:hypothetical protein
MSDRYEGKNTPRLFQKVTTGTKVRFIYVRLPPVGQGLEVLCEFIADFPNGYDKDNFIAPVHGSWEVLERSSEGVFTSIKLIPFGGGGEELYSMTPFRK